jgi:hypothetical protein
MDSMADEVSSSAGEVQAAKQVQRLGRGFFDLPGGKNNLVDYVIKLMLTAFRVAQ